MTIEEAERRASDAADAWRVDAADATDEVPEHIRKDCQERAPGCRPVPDGGGGWQYVSDARIDSSERVERRD